MSDEEYDVNNFLSFCKTKNIICSHLFVYEKRVLFMILEIDSNNLLVYVQSKFPIYIKEGITIPITYIKNEDEYTKTELFYKIKKSFDINKQHFKSSCIKIAFIQNNSICILNRHNEIETFSFETNVIYNNILWLIDMENFYIKIESLPSELKNISSQLTYTLKTNIESKRINVLNYLKQKIKELESLNTNNFAVFEKRLDVINKSLDKIKNNPAKTNIIKECRDLNKSLENDFIIELFKLDLFINNVNEIEN